MILLLNCSHCITQERDRRGLYAKALAGILKGFTGIDDPYETPESPEVVISSEDEVMDGVDKILTFLRENHFFGDEIPEDA